ncbi:Rne/Rng family ribonuclease [Cytobacillus dafuensis]|uniref:Rne/Rng family ribonuclease n=1 Tax=Cytobacillus dafuensis TaxID=1742359 RepID=A0A5B8Z931_CYTDA|nr:Rne/Rng family ribonuclease [Cytobacillus dafuensis]QED48783.1 Rne/Rng family ribonuclease [Cytobacillus dafuensis]
MYTLIIDHLTREKRYALLKNNEVEKLVINQPRHQSSVGNIYLGIVDKVLPGMNAAFVDLGEGKKGYLHRDKLASFVQADDEKGSQSITSYVHQGERMLVQVEKDAAGTKGPRLTGIIEFQGENIIYMPHGKYVAISKKIEDYRLRTDLRTLGNDLKFQEEGFIFRTSSSQVKQEKLIAEIEDLRQEYKELLAKANTFKKPRIVLEKNSFLEEVMKEITRMDIAEIIVDDQVIKHEIQKNSHLKVQLYNGKENIFSAFRLEHEFEKALKRIVWLENGAYLIFDEAEALTVIDVNTGKFSGKNDLRETIIKTNKWAAIEAVRQIRLRDIGGMILIDFIDMKEEKDKLCILEIMKAELEKDERRTNLVGFTPLGILQLTRKKTKPAISESLTVKCPSCDGTGRILSPETVAFRLERELWEYGGADHEAVLIDTSEDVKIVFSGEQNSYKKRIEEILGLEIIFVVTQSEKPFYEIRQFGKPEELKRKVY